MTCFTIRSGSGSDPNYSRDPTVSGFWHGVSLGQTTDGKHGKSSWFFVGNGLDMSALSHVEFSKSAVCLYTTFPPTISIFKACCDYDSRSGMRCWRNTSLTCSRSLMISAVDPFTSTVAGRGILLNWVEADSEYIPESRITM